MNDSARIDKLEHLVNQTRVLKNRWEDNLNRQFEEIRCQLITLQSVCRDLISLTAPELSNSIPTVAGSLENTPLSSKLQSQEAWKYIPGALSALVAARQQSTQQPNSGKEAPENSSLPPVSPTPEPTAGDEASASPTVEKTDGPSTAQELLSTFGEGQPRKKKA